MKEDAEMNPDLQRALRAANSPEKQVRLRAAMWLGSLADDSVAEELVAILVREPDPFVRETLTWVIAAHGDATLPHLLAALGHAGPARAHVLHALSKIQAPEAVDHALALVDDPDPAVAAKAWWVLGRMGVPQSAELLVAHLGEQSDDARRADLTRALQHLSEPAVPALGEALNSPSAAVRRHAAEALVAIGEASIGALDALIMAASGDERDVSALAMEALVPLRSERVDQVLAEFRDGEDQWLATMAAWYLSERAELTARTERLRRRAEQR